MCEQEGKKPIHHSQIKKGSSDFINGHFTIFLRDGHYYKQLKLQGNVQFYPNSAGEELGIRAFKEMTQCHRVSTEETDTSVFGICLCYHSQSFLFSVCLNMSWDKNPNETKSKSIVLLALQCSRCPRGTGSHWSGG